MPEKEIKRDIVDMAKRYASGRASNQEKLFLEEYYAFLGKDEAIPQLNQEEYTFLASEMEEALHAHIRGEETVVPLKRIGLWPRLAAAASILLLLSLGGYFLLKKESVKQAAVGAVQDLVPGTNGAVLTLSDGTKIALGQIGTDSIVAHRSGLQIKKAGDSILVYYANANQKKDARSISYNTLETPLGKQYSVVLSDGSRVWLNAGSSLRFPTAFAGAERLVELSGEAYFEVIHNSAMPFRVKTTAQVVEDIGTEFNISAYTEEPSVKTTLVRGSVLVVASGHRQVLSCAGQQTVLDDGDLSVTDADMDVATGWKKGYFSFKKADIKTVMRQFARWYNVCVDYDGKVPDIAITGDMYRNENASEALQILSYFNIHYKIEDKKIIITQ